MSDKKRTGTQSGILIRLKELKQAGVDVLIDTEKTNNSQ